MTTPISQKRVSRHQLPAGHVAKLQGSLLYQELTKCNAILIKAQFISGIMLVGSVKLVLEGDLGVVDCYTGSDTGVIFLSEATVVNLSDTLQRRLKRLSQVRIILIEWQERVCIHSAYLQPMLV